MCLCVQDKTEIQMKKKKTMLHSLLVVQNSTGCLEFMKIRASASTYLELKNLT